MSSGRRLGLFLRMLYLLLGMRAVSRSSVDDFWSIWSKGENCVISGVWFTSGVYC